MLAENKKVCTSKLVYALGADWVSNNNYIWTSPFQLVYGVDVFLPMQLALHVIKLLQEEMDDPNPI